MAGTVTVRVSLQMANGPLQYQSKPTAYNATQLTANGPTPGSINVPVTGVDLNFSELGSYGGFCWLQNLSGTVTVVFGVRDSGTNKFYPLLDLLPGEVTLFRLSSELPKSEAGSGTFSGSATVPHAKGLTGSAKLSVAAFDP